MSPTAHPSHSPPEQSGAIDLVTLEHWWAEGRWADLVLAETQAEDLAIRHGAVLLFYAVAHLQTGKVSKAKYLVQKAIGQGCDPKTVKNALLAASVEKLATIEDIEKMPAADDRLDRARGLRAQVLESLRQKRRLQAEAEDKRQAKPGVPVPVESVTGRAPVVLTSGTRARIGILSGYYPGTRFNSQANHRLYAERHGYRYIFDSTPRFDRRTYMRKMEAIQEYLDLFDWLFWVDDDAYFTDFSIPLEQFIAIAPNSDFIVCKSPSTKELSTHISSGQFLLHNTPGAHRFIADALATDLVKVKAWWRSHLGMFTKGDQDALVYLMETDPAFAAPFYSILDHQNFNNRNFEYESRLDEHFLVHFTGKSKVQDKVNFCERMGCNEYICPPDLLAKLALR